MTEWEALLALNAVPGMGGARIRKLLKVCGSAGMVFRTSQKDLEMILSGSCARAVSQFDRDIFLKQETELLKKHDVSVVMDSDESFPALLKEISQPPVLLYVKGNVDVLKGPSLAIVGSRRASFYGLQMADRFAVQSAQLGIVVVSGMARGVDTAAHHGSLKAKGKTVAVLGCGLSRAYPPENKELSEKISRHGAVVSEFPMKALPKAAHFPQRNRIISGLSLGVVVVEASLKSGALITSRFALEQDREVFAVPGKIDQVNAQGTNRLIKQGAKLAGNIQDILEELMVPLGTQEEDGLADESKMAVRQSSVLNEEESGLYGSMPACPVGIDELVGKTGWRTEKLVSILFQMEQKRVLKQLPGKLFIKN